MSCQPPAHPSTCLRKPLQRPHPCMALGLLAGPHPAPTLACPTHLLASGRGYWLCPSSSWFI